MRQTFGRETETTEALPIIYYEIPSSPETQRHMERMERVRRLSTEIVGDEFFQLTERAGLLSGCFGGESERVRGVCARAFDLFRDGYERFQQGPERYESSSDPTVRKALVETFVHQLHDTYRDSLQELIKRHQHAGRNAEVAECKKTLEQLRDFEHELMSNN